MQVRKAFNYCLCLMMVEAGRMELVETVPGEEGPIFVFGSVAGEPFAVARPPMTDEDEALMSLAASSGTLLDYLVNDSEEVGSEFPHRAPDED